MREPITRRAFLRDSAFAVGAVVALDPGVLVGNALAPESNVPNRDVGRRSKPRGSDGPFAAMEYGDGTAAPLIRWTRFGGDASLELWTTELVLQVPSRSETAETIQLADFESGRYHDVIVQYFGSPVLMQVRTEVALRGVFPNRLRVAAA